MKPLYDNAYAGDPDMQADFGWKEKEKLEELRADAAWYLVARTQEGTPVAFSHFRYDMDYDDEVVYCYEIQVEVGYRRKGLGRFMMKVLEMLTLKADMQKLMATIFKKDKAEEEFFKKALKFEMDETSFVDTVNEQFEHEILCRSVPPTPQKSTSPQVQPDPPLPGGVELWASRAPPDPRPHGRLLLRPRPITLLSQYYTSITIQYAI
jgi:GNAT superfamily N-acetyltransferase